MVHDTTLLNTAGTSMSSPMVSGGDAITATLQSTTKAHS
jgi:hypothetical protein